MTNKRFQWVSQENPLHLQLLKWSANKKTIIEANIIRRLLTCANKK